MNFLIMAPPYVSSPGEYYDFPLGLAYISAALKQKGYNVECLNLNHYQKDKISSVITRVIQDKDINVVCIGGLSAHYRTLRRITHIIHEIDEGIITIAGGGIISSEPELMLTSLDVDIGVIGEGEEAITEIAQSLCFNNGLEHIKGIIFRHKDGSLINNPTRTEIMNLRSIPWPDYEGFDVERYLDLQRPNDSIYLNVMDNPRMLPVISSRSCPYKCTFCFHPTGNRYRQRDLDSFFEEVEFLVNRFQLNMIAVVDELFAFDTNRLYDFCHRIKGYGLKWIAQLRVDQVDEDSLNLMKDSGLFFISYGIESMSDNVLKSMRKSIKRKDIESALSATKKMDIGIQGNLIFGDPSETWASAMESIEWWKRHPYYQINISALIPYPGSQIYKGCLQNKIIDRMEYIEQGCPPVNATAMDDFQYYEVFNTAYNENYFNKITPRVISALYQGYDNNKGCDLYDLTICCPRCESTVIYRNFHSRRLEYFKVACRNCMQRFDIPSTVFNHIHDAVCSEKERLKGLAQDQCPVAIAPFMYEFYFKECMQLLDIAWQELNIRFVIDNLPANLTKKYMNAIPVLQDNPEMIKKKCQGHYFIILPGARGEKIQDILMTSCEIDSTRIIKIPDSISPTQVSG